MWIIYFPKFEPYLKVYHNINDFSAVNNAIVTTGTFDGVHIGHKKIIDRLLTIAKKEDGETVLLTFYPHPRLVLFPENNDLKLLNTQKEKIHRLQQLGIDHLIIHPFTPKFSRLSSTKFVREILVNQLQTHKLVIGYDHRFGRNREGTFEHLSEFSHLYGFEVEEIPALDIQDINVSSTKIRKALENGDIETANRYLGYSFELSGKVIEGDKLGRQLGYPTANVFIEDKFKILPGIGSYCVQVEINGAQFGGMLNIGTKPTVNQSGLKNIEVHIFDFNKSIYGETITVKFVRLLRNERKFNSVEELKKQLDEDKIYSLNILHKHA